MQYNVFREVTVQNVMFDRLLLYLALFFMLTVSQVQAASLDGQSATAGGLRSVQNTTVFGQLGSDKTKGKRYRSDAINVKFKAGVTEAEKNNLHKRHGSTPVKSFDHLRMQHVKLKKGVGVEEALKSYQADPEVEHAEPDYLLTATAAPNDPFFSNLWGFNRINAPTAWDTTTGSSNVVIAVIDTGIDYTHPDLAANIWTNPGINVGYSGDLHGIDTSNHDSDPMDDHYHGTHVAGTIGAVGNNGVGVAGLSWNVKLMACKFLDATGNGYTADAIECLEYVRMMKAQGVNIVATNNSWGGGDDSLLLRQAIDAQRDILFIAAAGNDSTNNDAAPFYPASFALPNIISVAATDSNDNVASFSNTGRNSVHLAAPGTSIYSTIPGNSYQNLQGTSMAAPHVTGLAALLGAFGKEWKQIRNLIFAGGVDLASLSGKTITGRRIDAAGSVTCLDRPLFALQQMPDSLQAGSTVTLSAISINCGEAAGPVSVTITPQGGASSYLQLRDDGVAPDLAAGDGVFTGSWTPASSGSVVLSFSSPAGTYPVAYPPLAVAATATVASPAAIAGHTASANLGVSFGELFTASGGKPPYSWSVVAGSLPAGLSLNGATGEISGTPTATGAYAFTIRVTDSIGLTDSSSWGIVIGQGLRPGWPQMLQAKTGTGFLSMISSSPVFADLDGDGKDELIVGDYTEGTRPAVIYVFKENGLAASYQFPNVQPYARIYTTPAVADLFNDGRKQIIVSQGWPTSTPPLFVFDKDLNILPGFPAGHFDTWNTSPGFCGSPVVADFNNDGNKSILVDCAPNNLNDPNYGRNVLVMVDARGAMVAGWPKVVSASVGQSEPMPLVGDIDNDGRKEIVRLGADGVIHVYRKDGSEVSQWPASTDASLLWTPVMADFDGDGFLEIAVKENFKDEGITKHRISIFNRNGGLLTGWPLVFSSELGIIGGGGIIAADIDGDQRAELITNSGPDWSQWRAFKWYGATVSGWPTPSSNGRVNVNAYPVVGDLNGDGGQQFLYTTTDWWTPSTWLWGYGGGSLPLAGYPKLAGVSSEVRSTPALGDIDGNGRIDIAVKGEDGTLNVWESGQSSTATLPQWPMYAHDLEHTGTLSVHEIQQRAPVAAFLATPVAGGAPLAVSFIDTSDYAPTSWSWNFGDGGTSTLKNPRHSYRQPGLYTVSLTAANAYGSDSVTRTGLINVVLPLIIPATSPLPSAVNSIPYSLTIPVAGGVAPYTWSIVSGSGSLPTGLSLNAATGVISGTPSGTGAKGFTIQVTDASGLIATQAFVLTVNSTATFAVNTASLTNGTVGSTYNQVLWGSGGTAPYAWSLYFNVPFVNGSLPSGLSLDSATGAITGTPTTPGSFAFYARVTDATAKSATKRLVIVVEDGICSSTPLQVVGASITPYTDMNSALQLLANNDVIMLRDLTLSGNMNFTNGARVKLRGGYDCGFGSNNGSTLLVSGKLTVKSGTVAIDGIRLR